MSKKSEQVEKLLAKIGPPRPVPTGPPEGSLLDLGMLCVLLRHLPQERAESALAQLKKTYADWNELRVSQTQEIVAHLRPRSTKPPGPRDEMQLAARGAREYLQEVFQKTHGLDLEFLREDLGAMGKVVTQMPFLGVSAGSYLMWVAGGRDLPVHSALVRVLDRIGLIQRTGSAKKARDQIEPLVPSSGALAFVTAFGEVADRWCDARKPMCWECVLVEDCVHGRKAYKEWQVQQTRLEAQRRKEEARRLEQERKDRIRREREEARQRKRDEAEERKRERERQRRERIEGKKREQERKRDAQRKKVEEAAAKKAALERARAAKSAGKKKPARLPVKAPHAKPRGATTSRKSGKPARRKATRGKR